MSVTIRPYRRGGWEVDVTFRLPSEALEMLDWMAAHRPRQQWMVSVPGDCPFLPRDLVARLHEARTAWPLLPRAKMMRSPLSRSVATSTRGRWS